ncbi:MAG: adenosine deaminase [Ignavibacteriaceae bacterium]|nr:adenosine deaminase [Ignavibacteriaceae bacterium]
MTSEEIIKKVPKVLLHDHLDGSLRPSTIIELADKYNYTKLPSTNPEELASWFFRGANKGNLVEYLQGFEHTCAIMQTKEALKRVAFENLEDCKKDGICYIEIRFAPVFHTLNGLYPEDVVAAVLEGLEEGREEFKVDFGLILCGMRNMKGTEEIAELAVNFRKKGVVGFDLAGEEGGYPPKKHIEAFDFIKRANFNITIHAGEAFGKESIWQALQWCGAHRIGHGTRLIEDMTIIDEETSKAKMGELAQFILDKRIPIEICLLSNVHTGAVASLEEHPLGIFYRNGFRVTLNTDNRLMSNTSMTKEFVTASKIFNLNINDIEKITINSMKSAFRSFDDRLKIIYDVIKPGFSEMKDQMLKLT